MSLIWSRKHSCKKLRLVNIFDCLFDLVQTALMQRVEIFDPETLKKKNTHILEGLPLPCHMPIEEFEPVHRGGMHVFDTAD